MPDAMERKPSELHRIRSVVAVLRLHEDQSPCGAVIGALGSAHPFFRRTVISKTTVRSHGADTGTETASLFDDNGYRCGERGAHRKRCWIP